MNSEQFYLWKPIEQTVKFPRYSVSLPPSLPSSPSLPRQKPTYFPLHGSKRSSECIFGVKGKNFVESCNYLNLSFPQSQPKKNSILREGYISYHYPTSLSAHTQFIISSVITTCLILFSYLRVCVHRINSIET